MTGIAHTGKQSVKPCLVYINSTLYPSFPCSLSVGVQWVVLSFVGRYIPSDTSLSWILNEHFCDANIHSILLMNKVASSLIWKTLVLMPCLVKNGVCPVKLLEMSWFQIWPVEIDRLTLTVLHWLSYIDCFTLTVLHWLS